MRELRNLVERISILSVNEKNVNTNNIVKDALLKYTYSATRTQQEAARFLGISKRSYKNLLKKYKTKGFFEKD